jgi:integrase
MARRTFGSVRRRASGRYEASYWWEGKRYVGPRTYETKGDANAYLSTVEADIHRGNCIDPEAGQERFEDHARGWLADRHDLRPRTRELYTFELTHYLIPSFGRLKLTEIKTAKVRKWHAEIAATKPVTAAKCYRLLRTILATAVEDSQLTANPCTIKRAGQECSPERPISTVGQVDELAATVADRHRALVYTAAYGGLRLGECSALIRERVDLVHRTIAVTEQAQRVSGQGRIVGPPKSEAGKRTLAISGVLVDVLDDHLA